MYERNRKNNCPKSTFISRQQQYRESGILKELVFNAQQR